MAALSYAGYQHSTFVGRSLVPAGGHNLLEPAYWAKPILFGPHMEHFRDAVEIFLEGGAAIRVGDEKELAQRTMEFFGDRKSREETGRRAKRTIEKGSGATERTLQEIQAWLESGRAAQAAVGGGQAK